MPQPSPPLPPGGAPEEIDLDGLFARYEGMLIDSYGVLTYNSGPLPGAAALIERLRAEGRPHFVVTNDASRLPDVSEARPETLDVVVIGDESGYAFVDAVDATISLLIAAFSRGRSVRLVCPNPDLVYPKAPGDFGIASASVAGLIERAVRSQVPERAEEIVFASLGKPAPPLYEEAIRRAGTRDVVMLGDQPSTDIRGANAVGIDSVLLGTGLGRIDAVGGADSRDRPTWVMPSLVTRR
jgi:ribonucleotide monophosphatase NagD (HAD superfamily)